MYILLIIIIMILLLLYYYFCVIKKEKKLKIAIKSIRPKVLKELKREVILEPVDVEYYNKLKRAKEKLMEDRKKNYRMNKETINNEIAEIKNDDIIIDLRVIENLNNLEDIGNNNLQNVHDTTVQDTIKKKYFNLRYKYKNKKRDNIIEDVIQLANHKIAKDKVERLKFILEEIYKRDSNIINLKNATEIEVLNMMWDIDELKEQIINELLDCYEPLFNGIVCPTGVVSRLLNADIVLDPESTPRTITLLRTEMLNIASKIRIKCEEDSEYKELNEEEQNKKLKEAIKEELNRTYVNIISAETIQKELDTWIDYI
jgi:hypothetical protein